MAPRQKETHVPIDLSSYVYVAVYVSKIIIMITIIVILPLEDFEFTTVERSRTLS